jgi:protein-L-isoaspartate(D-aspartate) O-methyltransferase
VPAPLQAQLAEGGRLVIPVGEFPHQKLVLIRKTAGELVRQDIVDVRFVPMTGSADPGRPTLEPDEAAN